MTLLGISFSYNLAFSQFISHSSSNPINNLLFEHNNILDDVYQSVYLLRPFENKKFLKTVKLSITHSTFYNSGHTNIDNNGEYIAYPNLSNYTMPTVSYYNSFLFLKISPLFSTFGGNSLTIKDNTNFEYLNNKLNNKKSNNRLAQSTLAIHYNELAIGVSNENMWIGPGFHSSLTMSNNSSGFKHFFVGTINEKKIGLFGLNFRYFISKRKNTYNNNFYHTALASSLTFYSAPTITIGFNRLFLSGGIDEINWTLNDAAKLVIDPIFGNNKSVSYSDFYEGEPFYWDPWDQLLAGFINLSFPENNLNLYLELGTDDSRANFTDLKAHWDHQLGYTIGFKKYNLLNNKFLFFGIEYFSTKNSSNTLKSSFYRGDYKIPNFYNNDKYLFSSFDGRRWVSHSGSDSDERILLLGYNNKVKSLIFTYNIERRGVVSQIVPEYKSELSIIFKNSFNKIKYSFFLEKEVIHNPNFNFNNFPLRSTVIGLQIFREISVNIK